MKRTPYMDKLMADLHRHLDAVEKDMQIYDFTGVMDLPAQDAALKAIGPILDQMIAEQSA